MGRMKDESELRMAKRFGCRSDGFSRFPWMWESTEALAPTF